MPCPGYQPLLSVAGLADGLAALMQLAHDLGVGDGATEQIALALGAAGLADLLELLPGLGRLTCGSR